MQLTTQNIIKILPFEEVFKKQLLEKYQTLDINQRYTLEQLIWRTYYTLFELKLEENMDKAYLAAEEKGETPGKDFYQKIRAQTEQELMATGVKTTQQIDLSSTREELSQILSGKDSN